VLAVLYRLDGARSAPIQPALIRATRSPDESIATLAVMILAKQSRSPELLRALVQAFRRPSPELIQQVAEALFRFKAVKELGTALRSAPLLLTRAYAASTLARLGLEARPALPPVLAALHDPARVVRLHAVSVLANLDHKAGLEEAARDKDPEVRQAAKRALEECAPRDQEER
tara:strand:+ start:3029 stop:3547 length:519 start_codon:yes stop_codon:yes gene_type:complete